MENVFFDSNHLFNSGHTKLKVFSSFLNVLSWRLACEPNWELTAFNCIELKEHQKKTYPDLAISSIRKNEVISATGDTSVFFPEVLIYIIDRENLQVYLESFSSLIKAYPYKENIIFVLQKNKMYISQKNKDDNREDIKFEIFLSREFISEYLDIKIVINNEGFCFYLGNLVFDKNYYEIIRDNWKLSQEINELKYINHILRRILNKVKSTSSSSQDLEYKDIELLIDNFFINLQKILGYDREIDITKHIPEKAEDSYIIAVVGWSSYYKQKNINWEQEVNTPIIVFEFPVSPITSSFIEEKLQNYEFLGVVEYYLFDLAKREYFLYSRLQPNDSLKKITIDEKWRSPYLNIKLNFDFSGIFIEGDLLSGFNNNYIENFLLHQSLIQQKIDLSKERNELLNSIQLVV
ncbi:MAG: hypothetical protein RML72_02595 [Bacteroidia bacterium]|nr:hypothetical protein [Bacteroidia bacterium]